MWLVQMMLQIVRPMCTSVFIINCVMRFVMEETNIKHNGKSIDATNDNEKKKSFPFKFEI